MHNWPSFSILPYLRTKTMRCFQTNIVDDLILLNLALFLCFIFMSASLCLESPPSVSFNLATKSSNSNVAYNINLSVPFSDMVDYVIKRASLTSVPGLPFNLRSGNFNSTFDKPSINVEASKTTIFAGDSFSINCSSSYVKKFILEWHYPAPHLSLSSSNVKITTSPIVERNDSFFRFSKLRVKIATVINAGMYTCEMVNEKVSSSINISVATKEGSPCKTDGDCYSSFLSCSDQVCHCKNGMFLSHGICSEIQDILCRMNVDCHHNITNTVCKENKCICENGFVFFHPPKQSYGSCIPRAKHGSKCEWNEQCKAEDESMICRAGVCDCDPAFIYLNNHHCYRKALKMYDSCELDGQCFDVSARAVCSKNQICICQYGYYYNSWNCLLQEETEQSKAQQVYRTAMIAAACFMISVVSIFVICIVKKSFCGNNTSGSVIPGWQSRSVNQTQRMASVNEEETFVADKPPSYDEVMLTPCTPPPNYTDILKLFPVTEGLVRHNSEPRLSVAVDFGANRNRANSFHTYENSVSNEAVREHNTPPPKYEPPSNQPRSRPSLHLDIPAITVSFSPDIEETLEHNDNSS